MELIKLGEKTYYIKNNTNIGVYKLDDENVILIDTGNDKEAGKKILRIIGKQNWRVKMIINTHSHADHIGGNNVIQTRTDCDIYSNEIETALINNTILEPAELYGASPLSSLKNKFLYAKESNAKVINNNIGNLEIIDLKGHSYDMIGVKTDDDVIFLGDALASENTINKYHIFYLYDVKEYLNTLEKLKTLKAKKYVLSHGEVTNNPNELIKANEDKINEIINNIYKILDTSKTFEEILKEIFDMYNLNMNVSQYYLVGTSIKAYLSYLCNDDKITYEFKENKMYYKIKGDEKNA